MSRSLSQREPQPQPAQAERIGYNYITAKERSMNVRGKVFVVTGAGNGIAREVTLQLLAKGARVAGVDLNGKGLEETAALATATTTTTIPPDHDVRHVRWCPCRTLHLPTTIRPVRTEHLLFESSVQKHKGTFGQK